MCKFILGVFNMFKFKSKTAVLLSILLTLSSQNYNSFVMAGSEDSEGAPPPAVGDATPTSNYKLLNPSILFKTPKDDSVKEFIAAVLNIDPNNVKPIHDDWHSWHDIHNRRKNYEKTEYGDISKNAVPSDSLGEIIYGIDNDYIYCLPNGILVHQDGRILSSIYTFTSIAGLDDRYPFYVTCAEKIDNKYSFGDREVKLHPAIVNSDSLVVCYLGMDRRFHPYRGEKEYLEDGVVRVNYAKNQDEGASYALDHRLIYNLPILSFLKLDQTVIDHVISNKSKLPYSLSPDVRLKLYKEEIERQRKEEYEQERKKEEEIREKEQKEKMKKEIEKLEEKKLGEQKKIIKSDDTSDKNVAKEQYQDRTVDTRRSIEQYSYNTSSTNSNTCSTTSSNSSSTTSKNKGAAPVAATMAVIATLGGSAIYVVTNKGKKAKKGNYTAKYSKTSKIKNQKNMKAF